MLDGIRETGTAIYTGKIKVFNTCKCMIKEFQSYAWQPDAVEDTPIKVNDHAMDSCRYFVKTMKIATRDINTQILYIGEVSCIAYI